MLSRCFWITVAIVLCVPSVASADRYGYIGVHPRDDGGLCYIEAGHYHVYKPKRRAVLYRDHGDYALFVGDPVAYGYDGERHTYYGHHPISVDIVLGANAVHDHDTEYCYLDGAHFHTYAPAASAKFELKGDAYWYVGTLPDEYERPRKRLVAVNAVYEPIEYARPVVVVEPPSAWVGISVGVGAHAHIGGHAHVEYSDGYWVEGPRWKHKRAKWRHKRAKWRHKRAKKRAKWRHKRAKKRAKWRHKRAHKRSKWRHKRAKKRHKRGGFGWKSKRRRR